MREVGSPSLAAAIQAPQIHSIVKYQVHIHWHLQEALISKRGREGRGGGICAMQEPLIRLVVHYTPHQRPMASMSTLVGQNGGGGGGGELLAP